LTHAYDFDWFLSFRYDTSPIIINCLLSDTTGTTLQPTEIGRSVGTPGAGSWDIFEIRPGSTSGNCGNGIDTGRAGNGNTFL
jgi:hypothetical protein